MTFLDPYREKDEQPGKTSARLVERSPLAAPDPAHLASTRWQTVATRARRPSEDIVPLDRICLHDGEDVVLVPARSILVARSDNGTTTVDLDGQSLPVRCSLDRLEAALGPFGFFRSHRAFLVNLRRVRRIVPWSRHVYHLLLDDSKETMVPLAKSRRRDLRTALLWP